MTSRRHIKAPFWALSLALVLTLSGCSSLLERDYEVTAAHQENPVVETGGFYRVETYTALRSALLAYVEEGMDSGTLRFPTTYGGNLAVDLEKARRQLLEEEPLGAYGLSDLSYHVSRIISYYDVTLSFTYRGGVDPGSLSELRRVSGPSQAEDLLRQQLTDFGSGFTALVSLSQGPAQGLRDALDQVCDDDPLLALSGPALSLTLYPPQGTRGVAEVKITYNDTLYGLRRLRQNALEAADQTAREVGADPAGLLAALHTHYIDPEQSFHPYQLMGDGRDQEWTARTYQLLCLQAGVPCKLLREGPLFLVQLPGQEEPIDPSDPLALSQSEETEEVPTP